MNAKEKAQELVSKYITSQDKWYLENLVDGIRISQAKQCAKIAVEEIIKEASKTIITVRFKGCNLTDYEYWNEVLKQIEEL